MHSIYQRYNNLLSPSVTSPKQSHACEEESDPLRALKNASISHTSSYEEEPCLKELQRLDL